MNLEEQRKDDNMWITAIHQNIANHTYIEK